MQLVDKYAWLLWKVLIILLLCINNLTQSYKSDLVLYSNIVHYFSLVASFRLFSQIGVYIVCMYTI